ncbi:DUF4430 domain-containing protein [Paenibacillus sp. T1]|uniref:DUF4430 domain-containing protein n=2 Tax=Paenibacillus glycinis TaxID=2697035 RepID=A0ABW9XM26_9BACL|nr:DUF4430 domain-containing protein [Paenibacillus glycinis]
MFSASGTRAYADAEQAGGTPEGYITLSVEKFTLGQGYYFEPAKVPFYAGENGAAVLTRALGAENIAHTGEITSAFYLAKVKDATAETHIPQYILDMVAEGNSEIGDKKDPDWLGEFDYTPMSGWMYAVNNVFPNVGFTDYHPSNGDVVRTQFTVFGFGSDLGGSDYNPGGSFHAANKDDLTALVATVNSAADKAALLADPEIDAAYEHSYDVLGNMESSQESVDRALADLGTEMNLDVVRPVLTIQGLTDQAESAAKQLSFQAGATDNVTPGIVPVVTLNGAVLTGTGGTYTANLIAGENTIVVMATDAAGNQAKQSFTVYYDVQQIASAQLDKNLAYILNKVTNPTFGTLGGEWSVLSLARANYAVPDGYYGTYYANAASSAGALMAKNGGVLDPSKSTEHSRLILGLASIGKDPRKFAGYDMTQALSDFDYDVKQGINGPIFALIAMDANRFDFPAASAGKTQATREKLIDYIVQREVKKGTPDAGGWGFGTTVADVDLTAMALQALTPYYADSDTVREAADRALAWLSKVQTASGGYAALGSVNSESIAQVVVALSGLNIDPSSDPRFVKNGYSAVDALLAFAVPDGGFKHTASGRVDALATDQGTYALVAFKRMLYGQNRLYDMRDAREVVVTPPDGFEPVIDIPAGDHDYTIPIYAYDGNKDFTIHIADAPESKVRIDAAANTALPGIKADKGGVALQIPKGAQILSGDAAALEILTTLDPADATLAGQIGAIVPSGYKLDSIAKAVMMGGADPVTFDRFVTLSFAGMKGKNAAFVSKGTAKAIRKFADDAAGSASGLNEYSYEDGNDLIVRTNHFTDFAAYATSATGTPGGGGPPPTSHVTLSIDKQTIDKGYVIAPESLELQSGDTVWTVLQRELNAKGIPFAFEFNAQYDSVYVQSIDGDGEFDHGQYSGWMYNVNGTYPNYGASKYLLHDGDSIQWRYTTNLGKDIGAPDQSDPDEGDPGDDDPADGGTGGGGSGGNAPGGDGEKTVIAVPGDIAKDHVITITKAMNTDAVTITIPAVKPKVVLNLDEVKDDIPMIAATKGQLSLLIDKGTALKYGRASIELLTDLDAGAALKALIQGGLNADDRLGTVSHAFAMGSPDQSVVFDKPVTLTIKGGKGQLAGFIEGKAFTPITVYGSEADGAEAAKGKDKFAYAFAKDGDLIIKTNHFTSFVTYSLANPAPGDANGTFDLGKLYSDADRIASWAYGAVGKATQKGFIQGSGGKLNPKASITRAEFAKLMVSVLELSANGAKTGDFKDVPWDAWYYPYVNAASQSGFVTGYADHLFRPNDTITREQMAVILAKALGIETIASSDAPNDMDQAAAWAKPYVQAVVSKGIMVGQDKLFLPKAPVTREMAAVVAMRAFDARSGSGEQGGQSDDGRLHAVEKQIAATAAFQLKTIADPVVGTLGGEWTVFGLARSGRQVPEAYYAKYYANLEKTLKEKSGVLHAVKYTEYDRVILALSSIGRGVESVAGYNLLKPLADFGAVTKQGINGPIFALIALDSKQYDIPVVPGVKTQTTRELLIDFILKREIPGGGWALGEDADGPDPDVTSMAIQGLTPYCATNPDARAAVDRGIAWLAKAQNSDGGYASLGAENAESAAQVVVALTGLGIDPEKDARFVKNGHSALEALLGFAAQDGGFYHVKAGATGNGGAEPGQVDPMATDQAMYALVAYGRFLNGQIRLYDMTDVK